MIKLPAFLRNRLPDNALAFDISVIFGGFSLQLITQMGWLLLAVRMMGPDGYGIFASLTSLTTIIGCFVGWGSAALLVRGVSAHPDRLTEWVGHGMIAIFGSGLVLGGLAMTVLPLFDFGPMQGIYLVVVLASDLIFGRIAQLCINIHMAVGKSARQSSVTVIIGACRLAAIAAASGLAILHGQPLTLTSWSWWYLGASIAAAAICMGGAVRNYGWPRWRWMPGIWREGFSFSAEAAVQAALKDLDKPIVLEILGASAAGQYATAFRIIETLVMPLYALAYATYGKMFQKASVSVRECLAYTLKLLPLCLVMGAVVGAAALIGAGLLPLIFGGAYADLPWLVRLLSPMPALLGAYMIAGDAMSAIGRQGVRLVIVSLTLIGSLLVMPWAMETAGLEGALLVRLGSACLSMVAVLSLLPWGRRGQQPFPGPAKVGL